MSQYPIKVRIGSEYAEDADPIEAVKALRGTHGDGDHRGQYVYLVRVNEQDTFTKGDGRSTRDYTHKAGEPVFGERVSIAPRDLSWEGQKEAQVSFPGAHATTGEVRDLLELVNYAVSLADMANAADCEFCQAAMAERKARYGDLV